MHRNVNIIFIIFILIILAFTYQFAITGFVVNTPDNMTCSDSDGGINRLVQGTTSGYKWTMFGYKQDTQKDICIPFDRSSKNRVREFYCEGYTVIRQNIACPTGTVCVKGACIFEQ